MVISVVINVDTRKGFMFPISTVGDHGEGSLQGVRSHDFLTEGVKNKMDFFRGYDRQCILYIDEHEPVSPKLWDEICEIVKSYGNSSEVIIRKSDRKKHRWYDYITLEALKSAKGDYIVHFDQDCNAFRRDDFDVMKMYLGYLHGGYTFVCQPSLKEHAKDMYWASTRFFICKHESLNLREIERCFNNEYLEELYGPINIHPYPCCFEHTIGIMAGEGKVLYPSRDDNRYLIFSWVKYFSGTLKKLNNSTYDEVKKYVLDLGMYGANDVAGK